MEILRVQVRWDGFLGAPGYSSFYFAGGGGLVSDAQQVADRVADAFDGLFSVLPTGVAADVQSEVEVIDSDTGTIIDFREITPEASRNGTGTGGYSAASGGVVNWRTNDVRFGRRIRGRTFIVPMAGTAYEADGTLSTAGRSALQSFGSTMVGGDIDSEFGVWSRPRDGSGGVFASATGYSVPDMAAVLRSRRD